MDYALCSWPVFTGSDPHYQAAWWIDGAVAVRPSGHADVTQVAGGLGADQALCIPRIARAVAHAIRPQVAEIIRAAAIANAATVVNPRPGDALRLRRALHVDSRTVPADSPIRLRAIRPDGSAHRRRCGAATPVLVESPEAGLLRTTLGSCRLDRPIPDLDQAFHQAADALQHHRLGGWVRRVADTPLCSGFLAADWLTPAWELYRRHHPDPFQQP